MPYISILCCRREFVHVLLLKSGEARDYLPPCTKTDDAGIGIDHESLCNGKDERSPHEGRAAGNVVTWPKRGNGCIGAAANAESSPPSRQNPRITNRIWNEDLLEAKQRAAEVISKFGHVWCSWYRSSRTINLTSALTRVRGSPTEN